MTAVTTRLVRLGTLHGISAATGELWYGSATQPDIYAHVVRRRLTARWEITVGKGGPVLASGRTITRDGALAAAVAAAHRPGLAHKAAS